MIKIEAHLRLAAKTADWWGALDAEGQARYIKEHPKSKKAKDAVSEVKAPASPADAHKVVKSKFTPKEERGIKDYSSDATNPKSGRFSPVYQVINRSLRLNKELDKETKAVTKALDATFATAETLAPIQVYRGLEASFANQLEKGSSFVDQGFVSTSSNVGVAKGFVGAKDTIMVINVPKGAKAISVAKLSRYEEEEEILLNRGQTFVVTDVTTEHGIRTVHVEYI